MRQTLTCKYLGDNMLNDKVIYSISKTGKLLVWSASLSQTPNVDGYLEIEVTSGQDTGKKVNKVRHVKGGKNIGRSNETTLHEQAYIELERLYTKQHEKGYVDNREKVSMDKKVGDVPKPTLADKYPDKAHRLPTNTDHIVTQPKIDGVRCFITKMEDGSLRFTSRSGKPIPSVDVIVNDVKDVLPVGHIMDGELYIKGYELQDIVSVIAPTKNRKLDELERVELYWYDYIPLNGEYLTYVERFLDNKLTFADSLVIKKLESDAYDVSTLEYNFEKYLAEGYEGLMIRDIMAPYHFGRRSASLLKYKKMHTDEFRIVDIIESTQDDTPRVVCDLRNAKTVTVRMMGDKEHNLEYLNNKKLYIGKWLTIKYQTWTKTGSLQFPVGEGIRAGEVVDGAFIPSL